MMENRKNTWWAWLTAAAVANCLFQLWWFSARSIREIDFDGMAYVGIARHISDGNFSKSINAFRSPLISWIMAALASPGSDFVRIGKLVSMSSALACAGLVFAFAYSLWHSREVAAIAMLWFSFARGFFPLSTELVTPDYLFAITVLLYFLVLIRCFRKGTKWDWLALGAAHSLAYLAKAFALPWLALSTLIAVTLCYGKTRWRQALLSLVLAAILPAAAGLAWGSFLHAKYGVFTTGSQLKANLLQWTLDVRFEPHDKGYEGLRDISHNTDRYGIVDPMPPGSPAWSYRVHLRNLVPAIIRSEVQYLPVAVKELLISVTVGGMLAFVFGLQRLNRNREQAFTEFRIVAIVAIDSAVLIGTYCMLVFDGRYIFPIVPLLIGSAAPFLIWKPEDGNTFGLTAAARRVCLGLVVVGILFTLTYWASPYRRVTRDYQESCYAAGRFLRQDAGATVVSFGNGPYPEHGVGWEVALKSAFFGDKKLVAWRPDLPAAGQEDAAVRDLARSGTNAVLVWGLPTNDRFVRLVGAIKDSFGEFQEERLEDPALGQVGIALIGPGKSLGTSNPH
jgi:hypothetical protein